MEKYDGGPAFPAEGGCDSGLHANPGMSLRDYFAARASEEDIDHYRGYTIDNEMPVSDCGYYTYSREQAKYRYADAMIEARNA